MRIKLIRIFFLVFLAAIIIRLFYWQVMMSDSLSAKAEDQHFVDNTVLSKRGSIYFSDMSTLASIKPVFSLFANPKVLNADQKAKVALELAKVFASIDFTDPDVAREQVFPIREQIMNNLSKDLFWVSIRKNLDLDTKEKIDTLNFPGIGFEPGSVRFYPEGSSSAHILGFVGKDSKGGDKGYFGLEGFFDRELKGIPGSIRHEKDAIGLPILIGRFLGTEPRDGKDLVLNIDPTVQYIVERDLKSGIEKYGAKAASVVVMEPKTGAILAMAAYPNYDPATFGQYPREYYRDPVVADQYEPGSTFKVLTMAAGIDQGVVKPDTKCDICDKPVSIGGFDIRTWNNKYSPNTTMTDVIIHSDNTGMVFMAKKLGLDKLYSYITQFGFGDTTNIDLQDEFSPDLRPKDDWREIDVATASFGQGIAATPIQMVRAVSAIANGGFLMEPHVVKEIKDDSGTYEIKPKIIRQIIKKTTADIIKEMMVAAVEQGEAKFYKLKGFKIAGKTGTAQIPVAGHYDANQTIASFVGFAPADDPKFVMLVRYDQPTSSIYGSETAAPTFFSIAKDLFPYFKIAPTEAVQ